VAYSIDQATLVASQLERFATSSTHHLVGQFANLDFWLDETVRALHVLDDYPTRFGRMRDAQVSWAQAHGTVVSDFCPLCGGACEFGPETPLPPRRLPSQETEAARRRLKDAAYRLLLRCHRGGLLDEAALRVGCDRVGTSVDLADLKPRAHGG
jgi:hypothetical protein